MTATINVNLKPCHCPHAKFNKRHWEDCPAGDPVLIPCPIPPSFDAVVSLGECHQTLLGCEGSTHNPHCKGRPIRVTCSIGGDGTWAGSEVRALSGHPSTVIGAARDALFAACRERWALVKALVTGGRWEKHAVTELPAALVAQRDSVFAALADMARAEKACHAAFLALPMDLRKASIIAKQCGPVAADPEDGGIDLPSAKIFALYVERIIEQVGVLP